MKTLEISSLLYQFPGLVALSFGTLFLGLVLLGLGRSSRRLLGSYHRGMLITGFNLVAWFQ